MPAVGDDLWWSVRPGADPGPVGDEVARAIVRYALPVLRTLPAPWPPQQEPIEPSDMTVAPREDFAEQLWRYGEHALAVTVLDTDDRTFRRIMLAAAAPLWLDREREQPTPRELLMALGAVEVLDRPRPLARRSPLPRADDLWQRVGRKRDTRDGQASQGAAIRVARDF